MLKTTSSVINASQIATPITLPGNVTLSTGNLVIGTAGKGIDFSADPSAPGMTSTLLDDYEEGTWTGTLTSATPPTTPITATGRYTKVGRLVTATVAFINVDNTGAAGQIKVAGLPFASNGSAYAIGQIYMSRAGAGPLILDLGPSATEMNTVDSAGNGVSWVSTGPGIYGTVQITYQV